MKRNLTIVLLSFVLLANKTFSQKIVSAPYYKMTNFDSSPYKSFRHAGGTTFFRMPFRLLFPKGYDSSSVDTKTYPMIVMLHGYGESAQGRVGYNSNAPYTSTDPRLNNNDHQLLHHGQEYLQAVNSGQWPGFVLFPQNVDGYWTEALLDDVATIVKSLSTSLKVDPNRIHVTGLSSGGQGVWDILKKYPNLFASGISYSGVKTPEEIDAPKTLHIPLWYFQGGKDIHPSPSYSSSTINALRNAGGTPIYTLYPTTDHGTWYQAIKESDFFPYLLRNSKLTIHPYFGKTKFEPGETISARLGITAGFAEYEWRKDNVTIQGANSNEIVATAEGSYTVRFKRANSDWTDWSNPLIIKVNIPTPPIASIVSPLANATFVVGSSITINANASDSDGSISKVEFFQGTVKLGEDLLAPYSFTWAGASVGSYSLTVKATDNSGLTVTSTAVGIVVEAINTPPTASITSPANNASFIAGSSVIISTSASDIDGTVRKVEFFQGSVKLGEDISSPYSFEWINIPTGVYNLTVKATDDDSATTISSAVSISVEAINTAPTASISSPANNASFVAGSSVTISASASDADGTVSKVEFFQGSVKLGEDTSSPYSFTWNNVAVGAYALTVKATDDDGASFISSEVKIKVTPLPTCAYLPWNALTAYKAGNIVSFNGNAYEALKKNEGKIPSKFANFWSLIGPCDGSANQAPTVSVSLSGSVSSFTAPAYITINATAADADGTISKVEFFEGAVKLGEDTSAPYSFAWSNVTKGSYTITAKATDNKGASSTSSAISITVENPKKNALSLYPNTGSSGNVIHMLLDRSYKNVKVTLRSPNGKSVFNYSYQNVTSIDLVLPSLAKGMHFVEIQADKAGWIEKLFIN